MIKHAVRRPRYVLPLDKSIEDLRQHIYVLELENKRYREQNIILRRKVFESKRNS